MLYLEEKALDWASLTRNVMKDSYLATPLQAKHRVWNLDRGTLEEVHDVEFDETKSSQVENENLEDVRGIQLLDVTILT